MIFNMVGGGGSGGGVSATIEATVSLPAGIGDIYGITVTATAQDHETLTGTTDFEGRATLTDAVPGVTYTVTGTKMYYTVTTATVTVENLINTVDLSARYGYGFAAVRIAIDTADTETRCTYPEHLIVGGEIVANSAYGLDPAYSAAGENAAGRTSEAFSMGGWAAHKILKGIRPVMKNGAAWAELNKTEMKSWSTNGDAFTEFPINWLSIQNDGSYITVIFSDNDTQPDDGFQLFAFAKGCDQYSNDQIMMANATASLDAISTSDSSSYFANCFHIGCFKASGGTSGIFSKRNGREMPLKYVEFWQGANARGDDYDCVSFQQWTYLQCLFLLLYRSTDSQTMHSAGISAGSRSALSLGIDTTEFGMAGSTTDMTLANAFFWIKDPWGNAYRYLGGLWNRAGTASKAYYWLPRQANVRAFDKEWSTTVKATQTGLGTDTGTTPIDAAIYIKEVTGTNTSGFLATVSNGTSTRYWPDSGGVAYFTSNACFPFVGGAYNDFSACGIFYCYVTSSSTDSDTAYVACLSYRGGHW